MSIQNLVVVRRLQESPDLGRRLPCQEPALYQATERPRVRSFHLVALSAHPHHAGAVVRI